MAKRPAARAPRSIPRSRAGSRGTSRQGMAKYRRPAAQVVGFSEMGHSGLKLRQGRIDEEFLFELKGRNGIKVYKEMSENDSGIGAVLFACSMLIRQAKRTILPFDEKSAIDKEVAEFVDSNFEDMSHTPQDLLTEILSMLSYGWAYHEIVYKKRNGTNFNKPGESSKHKDGLIGWRKLPLRSQDSLDRWEVDSEGGVTGLWQRADSANPRYIPISKSLLFRTQSNKNSPEGRSILRSSYRDWYFKKRIQEIEGVGIERDLAGLPVLQTPENLDIWDANNPNMAQMRREAEMVVRNVRRDEQEGILLPFGWELSLLSTGGQRNFDTSKIIDRYSTGIAMTVLADFIVLGHNNRYGSFALAGSKTHMFGMAITGWLESIRAVFNRYAIPRLLAINGMDAERVPQLVFSDTEVPNLAELGKYINDLYKAGFKMFPNIPLEKKLLSFAGLPTEGLLLGQEALPKPAPGDDDDDDNDNSNNPAARRGDRRQPPEDE